MSAANVNGNAHTWATYKSPFSSTSNAYRPALLTQPHNLRAAFRAAASDESKALFGVAQGIPSVFLSKVLGQSGTDFVWLDLEHSVWDRSSIYDAIHAIHHHSEGRTLVFVRVPKEDEISLTTAMDAGADGIMLPHTESVEEVKEFVKKVRYPPVGQRSLSPWIHAPGVSAISMIPNDDFNVTTANEHIAIIAQVESIKGVAAVDEIAALDEVSAVFFGPGDFRLDAGLPITFSKPWDEPVFLEAVGKVGAAGKKYGKPAIGNAPEEALPAMLSMGYRAILVYFDYWSISQDIKSRVTKAREITTSQSKGDTAA